MQNCLFKSKFYTFTQNVTLKVEKDNLYNRAANDSLEVCILFFFLFSRLDSSPTSTIDLKFLFIPYTKNIKDVQTMVSAS